MESIALAKKISELAADVKATDIKVLDLSKLSAFTDYFVVCSGSSDRQIRAIADKVVLELKAMDVRPVSKEGFEQGEWVLVDYADVVLHVFSEECRRHYDLEGFWNRAPKLAGKSKKKPARAGKKPVRKTFRKAAAKPKRAPAASKKKAPAKKTKASPAKKKKK